MASNSVPEMYFHLTLRVQPHQVCLGERLIYTIGNTSSVNRWTRGVVRLPIAHRRAQAWTGGTSGYSILFLLLHDELRNAISPALGRLGISGSVLCCDACLASRSYMVPSQRIRLLLEPMISCRQPPGAVRTESSLVPHSHVRCFSNFHFDTRCITIGSDYTGYSE